jgi:hypothetical protein
LAYTGQGHYKSRKRLIRNDLDTHFWPFCKGQGKEHLPETLMLTQIICGDILEQMAAKVHKTTSKLQIFFNPSNVLTDFFKNCNLAAIFP